MRSVCPYFLKGSCRFGRRCRNFHDLQDAPNQHHTSSEERIIDTVPTGPENKSNEDDNDGENVKHEFLKCIENELQCNVCQEIYIKPIVLNCSHTFCDRCIESWTRRVNQCPLCREQVTNKAYCKPLDTFLEKIIQHLPEEIKARREALKKEGENIADEIVDAAEEEFFFFDPPLMVGNGEDLEDNSFESIFIESRNDENSVFCTYCGSMDHSIPNCPISAMLGRS